MSGPHDFSVRSAPFVKSAFASIASRPASVTIASRPSEWDGTKSQYACFYPAVKQNSEIPKFEKVTRVGAARQ